MHRRAALTALGSAAALAGCGTLPREAYTLEGPPLGEPLGLAGLRTAAAQAQALGVSALLDERARRAPIAVLALSGGGANGAYGAGVLCGWSITGSRPVFDLVTGVSTGALAAPFAFVGSGWDDRLREVYAGGASSGMLGLRRLQPFRSPGLFSQAPLRELVDRYLDAALMQAVAAEHASGRRLLVATTNLDAEESMLWNMGAIAAHGTPRARRLFGDVLVASAAIPGVFAPVMIDIEGPNGRFREMHVDGAVASLFFALPPGVLPPVEVVPGDRPRGQVFLVVNGKVERGFAVTRGNITGVLGRSYEALRKSAVADQLTLAATLAGRSGLTCAATAIPRTAEAGAADFSAATMKRLFDIGSEGAKTGQAFATLRPALP